MDAKTAFIFPGQGAQVIGMGKDFYDAEPAAKQIFDWANEIVGYDLADICFNGPEDKLNSTVISQPAIFTVSAAILEVLKEKTALSQPAVTAGLSLGEYTAIYAAGVISFEDALGLVQLRGQAMQAAADTSKGSMVSVIGLDAEQAEKLCDKARENQLLSCANFNCPGQIVMTGEVEACKRVVELAEEFGAIKAIELKVAGAFHSAMMAPAAEALKKAIAQRKIIEPDEIKIIANVDAEYYQSPEQVQAGLVKQLTNPVLWQKCVEKLLADGVEQFYEIGPGKVLTGLMRRINRKTAIANVSSTTAMAKV
ncbi:MAG: ACP S-malonyltransferase [Anaerohalosphaeraceae bacterium]|nr:ACP S-malonyltransferase [Anaerohalosphaeraceae bacterium]